MKFFSQILNKIFNKAFSKVFICVMVPISLQADYSERFDYKISWKYMTVGYSSIGTKKNIQYDGKKVWMFESTARANSAIQYIFPVEDRIISFWDPKKKRTLWHEKNLSEGNYKRINRVHFNYDSKKAVWWQRQFSGNINESGLVSLTPRWKERDGVFEGIEDNIQDILSIIYIMRNHSMDPSPGDKFQLPIFDDNRFSRVWIEVLDFQELEVTINGQKSILPSLLVQPKMETSGVFRTKGNIFVWISKDERRIPLKVEADMPVIGIVEAEIYKMDYSE